MYIVIFFEFQTRPRCGHLSALGYARTRWSPIPSVPHIPVATAMSTGACWIVCVIQASIWIDPPVQPAANVRHYLNSKFIINDSYQIPSLSISALNIAY